MGVIKVIIELRVVQFWSARSFDFEITPMISDQIAPHSVQLPLLIVVILSQRFTERFLVNFQMGEEPLQLGDDFFSKAQQ